MFFKFAENNEVTISNNNVNKCISKRRYLYNYVYLRLFTFINVSAITLMEASDGSRDVE